MLCVTNDSLLLLLLAERYTQCTYKEATNDCPVSLAYTRHDSREDDDDDHEKYLPKYSYATAILLNLVLIRLAATNVTM